MHRLLLLLIASILVSCTLGPQPLVFSTPANLSTTTPARLLLQTAAPSASPTAEETHPAILAGSTDPFAVNVLHLPAPECSTPTPQQTEGPYYMSGSPERNILYETGMSGEKLIVAGYVLGKDCQPVPGAWVDFWQADANGVYDNNGYTLRGHQFTDSQGRYFLETVIPGEYPGRTEHIHFKVETPGGDMITSQLYFPDVSANNADEFFDPKLIVTLEAREGLYVAYYSFVLVE